ncbi:hypothetical protein HPB51_028546 [Rhipicephalus microplus]|uniref:Uncharacterized protein n=1 Tax=Rhipicephalus microplus TaxID=6941 RepID=A0A9J6CWR3_RHIMP|nr:hypothetical protein HPB51_028546 [Rhipicephalus microplus]
MKHCRTFESLKMRRISPKFGCLFNVPTAASVETVPPNDLALTIRQIVTEELLRSQQTYHRPSDFQDVYVNEPERVRTPVSLPPWQPSINAADAYEYQGTRQAGFPRHPTPNYERSFRPPVYPTSPAYSAPEGRHHYPMPSERSRYSGQQRAPRPIPLQLGHAGQGRCSWSSSCCSLVILVKEQRYLFAATDTGCGSCYVCVCDRDDGFRNAAAS